MDGSEASNRIITKYKYKEKTPACGFFYSQNKLLYLKLTTQLKAVVNDSLIIISLQFINSL